MRTIAFTLAFLCTTQAVYGQSAAYLELLRSDIRTNKVQHITEAMQFTEEESTIFWPVYREYEFELMKITDTKVALIRDFAANYESLTDEKARELADGVFDLEEQRTQLMREYFGKLDELLPTTTVAKFFQVERQIMLLLDTQIAAQVPLIK